MKKILLLLLLSSFSLIYSQTITTLVNNVTCFGNNDGMITAIATGGTPSYTFILMYSGGSIISTQSSNVFTNLYAGVYTVIVVDATTSSASTSAVVIEPGPLSCVASVIDDSVTGTTTGGNPPYFYSINGVTFQTNNTFLSIPSGTYDLTVKDANGCVVSNPFTILPLSIETTKFENFNYYPNSVSTIFNFSNTTTIDELTIYSILGEKTVVKKVNATASQIDLSNLTKGIYFAKFTSENQEKTIKIIKN